MHKNIQAYHSSNPNNDLRKKIQDYSYSLNQKIGKGFNSVVYRGINEKTKQSVAIKVIDIKTINKDKISKEMFQGQIDALRNLKHPNILKSHDIYSTINNCYIITEFCNEGDLDNLLKKRIKLSEQQSILIFRDIYLGFKYLIESSYIHRDLKPSNIFLKDRTAKIGDFGFTKKVKTKQIKQSLNLGSYLYMSPQSLKKNIYSAKSQIWSLGVIFYQMLHGNTPWDSKSQKQLSEKISNVSISLIKSLSQDIKDFIRQCLTVDYQKRIDLNGMSNHPFILRILSGDMPNLLRKATSFENNRDKIQRLSTNQNRFEKQDQKHNSNNLISNQIKNNILLGKSQKQIQVQINWMRFLSRLTEMFPSVSQSSPLTMKIRFIIVKQLISQLEALRQCLDFKQNIFNIQGWGQFIKQSQKIKKYQIVISQYQKKYEKYRNLCKQWIRIVSLDSKLVPIANNKFQRSEWLSILGLSYCLQEIKYLWSIVNKSCIKLASDQLSDELLKVVHRVDFLTSYYQLNCLLVDNFNNSDYFTRLSKIQYIIENKPAILQKHHIKDIENKLRALQIIK